MRKNVTLLLAFFICSALVACGKTITADNPGATAPTPTTSSLFPTSTAGSTPVASKKVTITLQQTALQSKDIAATIQNGNATMLKAPDHASNCTILTLQMQVNGTWSNVATCNSTTALKLTDIATGASLAVDLGTKALASGTVWGPGTYRLQLQFILPPPAPGPADILYDAYSDSFTLG